MASSFIGLTVLATLLDGSTRTGKVTSIDEINGTIVLSSVATLSNAYDPGESSEISLARSELKGLKVVSTRKASSSSKLKLNPSPSLSRPLAEGVSNGTSHLRAGSTGNENGRAYEERESDTTKVKKQPSKRRGRVDGASQVPTESGYQFQATDPSNTHSADNGGEDEFDFTAGLLKFDKHAIFEQIRDQDDTDPALRLHSHNRATPRNIGINESVLSANELAEQQRFSTSGPRLIKVEAAEESECEDVQEAMVVEKIMKSRSVSTRRDKAIRAMQDTTEGPRRENVRREDTERSGRTESTPTRKGFVTETGIALVEIKLKQYRQVLSIADIETGPTLFERTENAARGLASLLLSTVLPQSNSASVCIFAADAEKALVALRTGVHLCHRGIKVVVVPVVDQGSEEFTTGLRVFSSSGGRIIRETEDLASTYSLLIDAFSCNEIESTTSTSAPPPLALLSYVSQSLSPLLSIDSPYGLDHDTSSSLSPVTLSPDFLVCRGAVRKNARTSTKEGGQIWLLDVGIGPSVWARVGVEGWERTTFGREFSIECLRV